jgi:hypothetical protein
MLILVTIFMLIAFAFIVNMTWSPKITKPIVNIAENFPNPEFHSKILQESQVSYTKVSEKAETE